MFNKFLAFICLLSSFALLAETYTFDNKTGKPVKIILVSTKSTGQTKKELSLKKDEYNFIGFDETLAKLIIDAGCTEEKSLLGKKTTKCKKDTIWIRPSAAEFNSWSLIGHDYTKYADGSYAYPAENLKSVRDFSIDSASIMRNQNFVVSKGKEPKKK